MSTTVNAHPGKKDNALNALQILMFKLFVKWYSKVFWIKAGNIAERFYDKSDGAYDDLREKLYYWMTT